MQKIQLQTPTGRSTILIGEDFRCVDRFAPEEQRIIVTDDNVWAHYGNLFPAGPVIRIGTGEKSKTLDTVRTIYEKLIEIGADRSSWLVGIGGGVVCDVTGFAASTFMRGVRFGFAASTLLAQVDASVGGKNGVNFLGYKNIVGVFRQPDFVICDPAMLATLPQSEAANGLAEVVKHGAIGDADLFCFLEQFSLSARELEPSAVERMVAASVTLKAAVVRKDEQEAGQRRILNFGHTLGHALEKVTGMSHGEAVSVGMVAAARLSVEQGLLPASEAHRIERLLDALGLPTSAAADAELLAEAMGKDKKREGKRIHMVLIRRIGEAVVQTVDAGDAALLIQR